MYFIHVLSLLKFDELSVLYTLQLYAHLDVAMVAHVQARTHVRVCPVGVEINVKHVRPTICHSNFYRSELAD